MREPAGGRTLALRRRTWIVFFATLALIATLLPPPERAAAQDPPEQPDRGEELTDQRTASSKTYLNPDGTFTTEMFTGPIHFRAEDRSWRDIRSELVPTQGGAYAWRNDANSFDVRFKDTLGPQHMRFEIGGEAFTITLVGAPARPANATDAKVSYAGVFSDVDLRYDILPEGVKETLLLKSASAPKHYRFRIEALRDGAALRSVRQPDGSWEVFTNASSAPAFVLAPPVVFDGDGVTSVSKQHGFKEATPPQPSEEQSEGEVSADPAPSDELSPQAETPSGSVPDVQPSPGADPAPEPSPSGSVGVSPDPSPTPDGGGPEPSPDPAQAPEGEEGSTPEEPGPDEEAVDDATKPTRHREVSMHVARAGKELAIDLAVNAQWLKDPARVFPIALDPTITIQPTTEDASWDMTCSNCVGSTSERLKIGTERWSDSSGTHDATWRSALQFDISSIPAGVNVSDANLQLLYAESCLETIGQSYCNGSSQIDVHRMTSAWSTATTSSQLGFDSTVVDSYTHPGDVAHYWLDFDVTSTVSAWKLGTQSNYGLLLKRATEPANASGPRVYGRRYAAEPTLHPKLVVTYDGDGVELFEPDTLHSDGADLSWATFTGPSGAGFSKYEVHRSTSASFTPDASTLLATITDVDTTTYRDTTAAPQGTFTYRVVANSSVSNPRTVTLPADGTATKFLQPDAAAGKTGYIEGHSWETNCDNYGAEDRVYIGPSEFVRSRPLVSFGLTDIPSGATITAATMSLWRRNTGYSSATANVHRATRSWAEGTEDGTCNGTGATWYDADPTTAWSSAGGDYAAAVIDSVQISNGIPPGWDDFDITTLAQSWVDGTNPNHGMLLKFASDDYASSHLQYQYLSDDETTRPTLRPKLAITYEDGSHAQGPSVTVNSPMGGATVSGESVAVTAAATDDRRVESVQFFVDGNPIGTDTSAPYAATWDSTSATNASHDLTAKATDDAGNHTTSQAVSVTVDNSALPTVDLTAPAFDDYDAAVLGDSPLAYWRLGEGSGTSAADGSGNSHTGTYVNAPDLGVAGALLGDDDTAASFDGSADKMTVPDASALRLNGDFTIEFWGKLNSFANSWPGVVKKGNATSSGTGYIIYYGTDHRPVLKRAGKDGRKVTAAGTLSTSEFKHYVVTFSATDSKVRWYVDGALDATYTTTYPSNTDSSVLQIGTADQLGNEVLDEVAFYPSALSATEISAHYDAAAHKVSGTVAVTADASDDVGVTKVEFYADGSRFAEDDTAPYAATWDTLDPGLPAYDGVHELTARVFDTSGQDVTSQPVTVYVDNTSGTPYQGTLDTTPVPEVVTDQIATDPDDHGVEVTITNTSDQAWGSTEFMLVPRWVSPDPVPVYVDEPSVNVGALASGASTAKTVYVEPPDLPEGVDRAAYTLRFDLKETSTGDFMAAKGNAPSDNPIIVNKELEAEALGLERYYHYEASDLGAGMGHLVNVANGNSLLRWTPFSSPGRGLNTVVDLTYNSLEKKSESPVGNNFSLSISSLIRFGLPLDVHPNNADTIAGRSNRYVEFTDGDGTTHRFTGRQHTDGTILWDPPPGVHLFLRTYSTTDPSRKWALTRPDRTTFFFDEDGYPSAVADGNGNELTFTLENTPPAEDPGGPKKRITSIIDAAGQGGSPAPNRSFDIDYYSKAESKRPKIRGKIQRISDRSGSALDFVYYEDGNLLRLIQRGGTNADGSALADRSFTLTYTTSSGDGPAISSAANRVDPEPRTSNQSTRLFSVRDPRGTETTFTYFGPGSSQDRWKLDSRTDREGDVTSYDYDITNRTTTVTAPLSRVSEFDYDTDGKVTSITDPIGETTAVQWSTQRHVTKVTEPSGEFTTFDYNDNGYLTDRTDQVGNHTDLTYEDLAVKAEGGAADPRDASTYWPTGRTIPHLSQLDTVTDPNAGVWDFGYDSAGNLISSKDPVVTEPVEMTYSSKGELLTVTDQLNNPATQFENYDANGFATKVTDPVGNITKLAFDDDGLVTFVQDPVHASFSGGDPATYQTRFSYDSFHRLGRSTQPLLTSGDPRLIHSGADYDPNDNVKKEYAPGFGAVGVATTMTYDDMDRVVQMDAPGHPAPNSGDPDTLTTKLAYDAAGRTTSVTSPKGVATTGSADDFATFFDYDDLDRIKRQKRHEVTSGTITDTLTTHFCYEALTGDLVWQTAPKANLSTVNCAATTPPSFTTVFGYDDAHRLTSVTDPENRTRSFTYDGNGNVKTVTDERSKVTTYTYDKRDLVTQVEEPFSATRNITTRFVYDDAANLSQFISPRAHDSGTQSLIETYDYDDANRLVKTTLPDDATTDNAYIHREYDPNGRLKMVSLPTTASLIGNVAADDKTIIDYLDPGWIKFQETNGDTRTFFTYNGRGQQVTRSEQRDDGAGFALHGDIQTYVYYPDGLLQKVTDKKRHFVEYEYDDNSNLLEGLDQSGKSAETDADHQFVLFYDDFDRMRKIRERPDDQTDWDFTRYVFDRNGNVSERFEEGREDDTAENAPPRHHLFTYDTSDRLEEHIDQGLKPNSGTGADCTDDLRVTFEYFETGWEKLRDVDERTDSCTGSPTYAQRQKTNWTYFDNGKLKTVNITKADGTSVENHTSIDYVDGSGVYLNGHRLSDSFTKSGSSSPCTSTCELTYGYDARDRLLSETRSWSGGPDLSYELDVAGNVKTESLNGTVQRRFVYSGNRLDETRTAGNALISRYLYESGNLECITDEDYTSGTTCPAETSGDLLSLYDYDVLDRVVLYKAFTPDTATVTDESSYKYDALDRVYEQSETHGSTTSVTDFTYLGLSNMPRREERTTSGNTDVDDYSYDAYGRRIALTHDPAGTGGGNDPETFTYGYDTHGSTSVLLGESDQIKATYGYTAYGDEETSLSSGDLQGDDVINPYRYTGKRFDTGSGTIDMGARRFGPDITRFLQRDFFGGALSDLGLSGDPLTGNRYALASGNPVSFVETDGHKVAASGGTGGATTWTDPDGVTDGVQGAGGPAVDPEAWSRATNDFRNEVRAQGGSTEGVADVCQGASPTTVARARELAPACLGAGTKATLSSFEERFRQITGEYYTPDYQPPTGFESFVAEEILYSFIPVGRLARAVGWVGRRVFGRAGTRAAKEVAHDAIRISDDALDHVLDRHIWSGSKTLRKSVFFDQEDVVSLIRQASRVSPVRQASGNLAYIVNAGREVGVSRLTGLPTEFYTVITHGDELVTAFPGFPR